MVQDRIAAGLSKHKKRSFPGTGLKIFLAVLASGLILLAVFLTVTRGSLVRDLKKSRTSLEELEERNSLLTQTKLRRIDFLEKQFVLTRPRRQVTAGRVPAGVERVKPIGNFSSVPLVPHVQ